MWKRDRICLQAKMWQHSKIWPQPSAWRHSWVCAGAWITPSLPILRRGRIWLQALSLAFALLACASAASAQFDTATVLGTVKDSNGAVIPGATVTLKNIDTGIS